MRYRNRLSVRKQEKIIKNNLEEFTETLKERYNNIDRLKILNTLNFIHSNVFQRYLSAEEIKEKFNFRSSDVVEFRKVIGKGIFSYLQKIRMEAAQKLLQRDCLEIYVISFALHYAHEQSFSRAFKKYVGISPSQYRKNPR